MTPEPDLATARVQLDELVRIPSISADPRARRRRATPAPTPSPRSWRRPGSKPSGRSSSTTGTRTSSASGCTRPTRRRSSCTRTTTCSRPGSSTAGRVIRSSRARATAASTGAAPPTTRRASSRTSRRCARGSTPHGALPCNVKVLVEGEEEIGSPGLGPFLADHVEELRADVLLLADAGNWEVGVPGLTYSLRGLASVDVTLRALDSPVHSGHGRRARCPTRCWRWRGCSRRLVDERGDPAFDGCWDDYQPPDDAERARLAALPHNVDRLRADWGVRDGRRARGRPGRATCSSGCGCGPRSPSSGSTGTRSRARRTRSWPRPRRASACGWAGDRTRTGSTTRSRAHLERRVPLGLELTVTPIEAVARVALRPDRAGRSTPRPERCAPASAPTPSAWASAGPSRSSGRSPTRSAASRRCCSAPPTPSSRIHGEDESLHLGDWHSLIRSEIALLEDLPSFRRQQVGHRPPC